MQQWRGDEDRRGRSRSTDEALSDPCSRCERSPVGPRGERATAATQQSMRIVIRSTAPSPLSRATQQQRARSGEERRRQAGTTGRAAADDGTTEKGEGHSCMTDRRAQRHTQHSRTATDGVKSSDDSEPPLPAQPHSLRFAAALQRPLHCRHMSAAHSAPPGLTANAQQQQQARHSMRAAPSPTQPLQPLLPQSNNLAADPPPILVNGDASATVVPMDVVTRSPTTESRGIHDGAAAALPEFGSATSNGAPSAAAAASASNGTGHAPTLPPIHDLAALPAAERAYCTPLLHESALRHSRHQHRESIAALDRILAVAPSFVPAWTSKGVAYKQMKDNVSAVQCFQRALALDPTDWSERLQTPVPALRLLSSAPLTLCCPLCCVAGALTITWA